MSRTVNTRSLDTGAAKEQSNDEVKLAETIISALFRASDNAVLSWNTAQNLRSYIDDGIAAWNRRATPSPQGGEGLVERLLIPTLEGEMKAMPGDWVIRGIKGEFYPCKPDIFAAIYDPV